MRTECDTCGERMSLWLDGRLDPTQIEQMEAHIAVCPICRAIFVSWRRADRMLASTPTVLPSGGFVARFQTRLDARRRRRNVWAGLVTLAVASVGLWLAVVALMAVSGLAVWQAVSADELWGQMVGIFLALGEAGVTFVDFALLVTRALEHGIRHPAFVAYTLVTGILLVSWARIVGGRARAHSPMAADAR
jgi:anti-sigma factor RsiW